MLLSNVLHDWDVPECRALIARLAAALPAGGRLLIHDVFLNDALDGPLPIALYSAALFTLTEGRAYSAGEYRAWLAEAGLEAGASHADAGPLRGPAGGSRAAVTRARPRKPRCGRAGVRGRGSDLFIRRRIG